MLTIKLKPVDNLRSYLTEKNLIIRCLGCREVLFPEEQVNNFKEGLSPQGTVPYDIDDIATDYLCNPDYTQTRLKLWQKKIDEATSIIIFSCGVGVQVVSSLMNRHTYAGADTVHLNGFQGLTPTEYDCDLCGDCLLNYTGGLCPITACSKSLLNGCCGGAKNGKCEVNKELDCGWEKIYNRLKESSKVVRTDSLGETTSTTIKLRDYSKTIP
ncbi:MAG: methylenetetrahydrofolate reductase C-terminal domain-containing protein [Elusimicrobiota bacterium]